MHLARLGHDVTLWARDAVLAARIESERANALYLPDVSFPATLCASGDLAASLRRAELIIAALPSHGTREILRRAAPHVPGQAIVLSAAKGLERDTLFRVSEIIDQELKDVRIAVLSGPSFAVTPAGKISPR